MRLSIVILLLIPAVSFATVTSVTQDGGVFTISGSGFGTKATAAPTNYTDSEGYTVGEWIDDEDAFWTSRDNNEQADISDTNQRSSNSTRNIRAVMTRGTPNKAAHFWSNNIGSAATGKLFFSYWFKPNNPSPTDVICQIKAGRTPSAVEVDGDPVYPDLAFFTWKGTLAINAWSQYIQNYNGSAGTNYFSADYLDQDVWSQYTIEIELGSVGVADGAYKAWLRTPGTASSTLDLDAVQIHDSGNLINAVYFENYLECSGNSNPNYGATYYYDDIYIDTTWARVVVGDNATYSSCTHIEMQIPVTWGANEITATVNQGSFGDNAFLIVIPESGIPEAGFSFNFGETISYTAEGISLNGVILN